MCCQSKFESPAERDAGEGGEGWDLQCGYFGKGAAKRREEIIYSGL